MADVFEDSPKRPGSTGAEHFWMVYSMSASRSVVLVLSHLSTLLVGIMASRSLWRDEPESQGQKTALVTKSPANGAATPAPEPSQPNEALLSRIRALQKARDDLVLRLDECAGASGVHESERPAARPEVSEPPPRPSRPPARIPFSEQYPAAKQQQDIFKAVGSIIGSEHIEAVDCTEYPCIVYADLAQADEEDDEPSLEQTKAMFEKLRSEGLGGGGLIVQRDPKSKRAAIAVGTNKDMRLEDLASSIAMRQMRYFSADRGAPKN